MLHTLEQFGAHAVIRRVMNTTALFSEGGRSYIRYTKTTNTVIAFDKAALIYVGNVIKLNRPTTSKLVKK